MLGDDDFNKQFSQIQKQTSRAFGVALVGGLISLAIGATVLVAAIWALGHFAFRAW